MKNNGTKKVRVGDEIKIRWNKSEVKKYGILTDQEAQQFYEKGARNLAKIKDKIEK